MILDSYKNKPYFPFEKYFESANQFAEAQKYWFEVLKSAEKFNENDWQPRLNEIEFTSKNIQNETYIGRVCYIVSPKLKKEISISHVSILGVANMIFKENQPISDEDYARDKEIFGEEFKLSEEILQGVTYQEALTDAHDLWVPFSAEVNKESYFYQDVARTESGHELKIESLSLGAAISPENEEKTLEALALFLQEGPAMDRVNNVFSPDEG